MAKITRSNGHKLDSIEHIQLKANALERPQPEDINFDLSTAETAVVSLFSDIPNDAMTAQTLGTERTGNGVIIDDHGLVLTIGYLISEASAITLTTSEGEEVSAETIAYDYVTGFGLVRALGPLNATPMVIDKNKPIAEGDPVIVIGHEISGGPISGKIVSIREFAGYWEYLLDEAIFVSPPYPNWGGTALVDRDGVLIGIGSLFVQESRQTGKQEPGNMFVPTKLLEPIYHDLVTLGRSSRRAQPWIGMFTTESEGQLIVAGIYAGGPAERAGLKPLDVILSVNGQRVESLSDMYRKIWGAGDAGIHVSFKFLRNDRTKEAVIQTTDRYALMKVTRPH